MPSLWIVKPRTCATGVRFRHLQMLTADMDKQAVWLAVYGLRRTRRWPMAQPVLKPRIPLHLLNVPPAPRIRLDTQVPKNNMCLLQASELFCVFFVFFFGCFFFFFFVFVVL